MNAHFQMFAAYNSWANGRLYAAAGALGDDAFRQDTGAFFGSLHGTLNHILAADRIWMHRFTGTGTPPSRLDAILFTDFAGLETARRAEDARIEAWIGGLTEANLAATFTYTPITNPVPLTQRLEPVIAHFFNHQTHHRGQCHGILTALGGPSLALDLVYFLRSDGRAFA